MAERKNLSINNHEFSSVASSAQGIDVEVNAENSLAVALNLKEQEALNFYDQERALTPQYPQDLEGKP